MISTLPCFDFGLAGRVGADGILTGFALLVFGVYWRFVLAREGTGEGGGAQSYIESIQFYTPFYRGVFMMPCHFVQMSHNPVELNNHAKARIPYRSEFIRFQRRLSSRLKRKLNFAVLYAAAIHRDGA